MTTPDKSLAWIMIYGITSREIFFRRYTYLDDERKNSTDLSVEYIAKNLETGEERSFLEGDIGDFCIVETGVYYRLDKGGTYEWWKKETDGDEVFICSTDNWEETNYRPVINGEPLFAKDKSDFQKELIAECTCGDILLVMDTRKGNREGIITIDNYLNNIDEIVYPEFPNIIYVP